MDGKEKLKQQITESAGNVIYTYVAHWNIVNRLEKRYLILKGAQIILTVLTTAGIVQTIVKGVSWLSWLSGVLSATSLGVTLYMLNFNLEEETRKHKDAANELWDVRDAYKSLLVDFDDLNIEDIRKRRDSLIERISQINKSYPGTDEKAFAEAQKEIGKYVFVYGEAERIVNCSGKDD